VIERDGREINRALPKSQFAKALDLLQASGPSDFQHLQGPSYMWAILNDARVRG